MRRTNNLFNNSPKKLITDKKLIGRTRLEDIFGCCLCVEIGTKRRFPDMCSLLSALLCGVKPRTVMTGVVNDDLLITES